MRGRRRGLHRGVLQGLLHGQVLQRLAEKIIEDVDEEEIYKVFNQDKLWVQQRFVEQRCAGLLGPSSDVKKLVQFPLGNLDFLSSSPIVSASYGGFWTKFTHFLREGELLAQRALHMAVGGVFFTVFSLCFF